MLPLHGPTTRARGSKLRPAPVPVCICCLTPDICCPAASWRRCHSGSRRLPVASPAPVDFVAQRQRACRGTATSLNVRRTDWFTLRKGRGGSGGGAPGYDTFIWLGPRKPRSRMGQDLKLKSRRRFQKVRQSDCSDLHGCCATLCPLCGPLPPVG